MDEVEEPEEERDDAQDTAVLEQNETELRD